MPGFPKSGHIYTLTCTHTNLHTHTHTYTNIHAHSYSGISRGYTVNIWEILNNEYPMMGMAAYRVRNRWPWASKFSCTFPPTKYPICHSTCILILWIHKYIHMYMHTHTYPRYACSTSIFIHACICTYIHTHVPTHPGYAVVHTYSNMHTHVHAHTNTFIHAHAHMYTGLHLEFLLSGEKMAFPM